MTLIIIKLFVRLKNHCNSKFYFIFDAIISQLTLIAVVQGRHVANCQQERKKLGIIRQYH